ncbi:MAG: F0F1 ATP synthase subunit epsilon [Myxococcales bacterium]|jgi:F-type H+-transporting ATPase subunit epsilon
MAKVHLEIVTPERKVVSADVDEVRAPGASGLFGVRPGHAPFITAVMPGELSFELEGRPRRYAIGGGFIEVSEDRVRVLADTAEAAEEIDLERAQRAAADAQERLKGLSEASSAFSTELWRVRRAAVRIQVAQKAKI